MKEPAGIVAALRGVYRAGVTRPAAWRRRQLQGIIRMLDEEEDALLGALGEDLGRPRQEGWSGELLLVKNEAALALEELDQWMAPATVPVPVIHQPGRARVEWEPRGVVLILAPWNYPILLLLNPLVASVAAGNAVLLKPSELAPATSAVLARLVPAYLGPEGVGIVEGDVEVAKALLEDRFDHIFFTGSTRVGRIVMQQAARHLTTVTLELGGKSPAVVASDADLDVAARRIAWGRFMNAGQTCVAPDYVLVESPVARALLEKLQAAVTKFYGAAPMESPDWGKVVSSQHLDRLAGLLDGVDVVFGGKLDRERRLMGPTIVWDPPPDSPLMQEEIFGPILPVLPVDDLHGAIRFVADRPEPLVVYAFTGSGAKADEVRLGTRSGTFVQNDTVVQLLVPGLPFGGLGPSGMGVYHGRAGFETMSHRRAILQRSTRLDVSLRYPPYSARKTRWIRRVL